MIGLVVAAVGIMVLLAGIAAAVHLGEQVDPLGLSVSMERARQQATVTLRRDALPGDRRRSAAMPAVVGVRTLARTGGAQDGGRGLLGVLAGEQATWQLPMPIARWTLVRLSVVSGDGRARAWLWPGAPSALRAPWHHLRGRPLPSRRRLAGGWWSAGRAANRSLDARARSHWEDLGRLGH